VLAITILLLCPSDVAGVQWGNWSTNGWLVYLGRLLSMGELDCELNYAYFYDFIAAILFIVSDSFIQILKEGVALFTSMK